MPVIRGSLEIRKGCESWDLAILVVWLALDQYWYIRIIKHILI